MQIFKFKRFGKGITTTFLLAAFLIGWLPAFAQKAAKPSIGKTSRPIAKDAAKFFSGPTNEFTSQAWESGELPGPLPLPSGDEDEAIEILASKIIAKNAESAPALITALRLSGFFITKKDGSVFLPAADGKGQGLAINGWEVAASTKLLGDGKSTSLADLNEALRAFPILKNTAPAELLMNGVRANSQNQQNKHLRTWAKLILALGKGGKSGEINPVQHLLIFRRLHGDLYTLAARFAMQAEVIDRGSENIKLPRRYGAAFSGDGEPFFSQPNEDNPLADQPNIPCRMDGNAPTIMDASATAAGYGYGELMDYLQNAFEDTATGTKLEKFSKAQAFANALLAYAKFVQSYAALEVKLEVENENLLIRTKNAMPGARKGLRATLKMNIGNWQMYNCIRLAMNLTAGIDFATLNDGPIGDVGVTWHLDKGGARDFYSNRTGLDADAEQIVGFARDGSKRIQDKGVSSINSPNVTYAKTDGNGMTTVLLEGSPQKNAKTSKARPVMKEAVVRTTIKLKAGEIKGDMVDVAGQAIGGIAGLVTMPTELLYRASWASSGKLNIPVRDWEDCNGGWSGEVSIKVRSKEWERHPQKKGAIGYTEATTSRTYEYDGTIKIENAPAQRSGAANIFIPLKGESDSTSKIIWEDSSLHTYRDNCGQTTTTRTLFKSNRREESGANQGISEGELAIDLSNNTFRFHMAIPSIPGKTTETNLHRPSGYCRVQDNEEKNTKSEWSTEIGAMPIEIADGTLDPDNPDLIEGSKSFTNSKGEEVEVKWKFSNCR